MKIRCPSCRAKLTYRPARRDKPGRRVSARCGKCGDRVTFAAPQMRTLAEADRQDRRRAA